jgi:hypothetical protein
LSGPRSPSRNTVGAHKRQPRFSVELAIPFGDALNGFVIKMINVCRELESRFLGGCPMFVWSAPYGLVAIHHEHSPPIAVLITPNPDFDLDLALSHVSALSTG